MVKRHNRLLVAFHVVTDAVLGMLAFVLAYLLRFETGLIAITRGQPPIEQYLNVLPFVALGRGGALDTVIDGETGVLFGDTTVESLSAALTRAASIPWDAARIRRHAEQFSRARFITEIQHVVNDTLSAPAGQRW